MSTDRDAAWLNALHNLKHAEAEEGLRDIARLLREGDVDPWALGQLAELIDPAATLTPGGIKLAVKRTASRGAPPKRHPFDRELVDWLEHMIDIFDEPAEAVYARAKERFGVGRSKCAEALKCARDQRDSAAFKRYRDVARRAREAGVEGLPDW